MSSNYIRENSCDPSVTSSANTRSVQVSAAGRNPVYADLAPVYPVLNYVDDPSEDATKEGNMLNIDNDPEHYTVSESSREALRIWSVRHNIAHYALKDLLGLIREKYNDTSLPMDPRTLLDTPQGIGKLCTEIAGGKYWHYGLAACLNKWFENLSNDINISVNINIDGLPIYKSSKFQLCPILCNIHEIPELQPMPIGIFLGKSKPANINTFLTPFVDELVPLLDTGFIINSHTITLKIRCFICDSPARAFVKGNGCFTHLVYLLAD